MKYERWLFQMYWFWIAVRYDYLKPSETIAAGFDEKNSVHVLKFCLDDFYKETVKLWSSGECSPSPTISEFDSDDSKFLAIVFSIWSTDCGIFGLWKEMETIGQVLTPVSMMSFFVVRKMVFSTYSESDWFYDEIKTGNLIFDPTLRKERKKCGFCLKNLCEFCEAVKVLETDMWQKAFFCIHFHVEK